MPQKSPKKKRRDWRALTLAELKRRLADGTLTEIEKVAAELTLQNAAQQLSNIPAQVKASIGALRAFGEGAKLAESELGPDAGRGRKVIDGASRGHQIVHGTKEEKERRYAQYQNAVNKQYKENPRRSDTSIAKKVAEDFGVTYKTILRHTKIQRS